MHPRSKFRFVLDAFVAIVIASTGVVSAQKTCVGIGDWENPANWSPPGVPGPQDDVVIPLGKQAKVDGTPKQVRSLDVQYGGTLVAANASGANDVSITATQDIKIGGTVSTPPNLSTGSQADSGDITLVSTGGNVLIDMVPANPPFPARVGKVTTGTAGGGTTFGTLNGGNSGRATIRSNAPNGQVWVKGEVQTGEAGPGEISAIDQVPGGTGGSGGKVHLEAANLQVDGIVKSGRGAKGGNAFFSSPAGPGGNGGDIDLGATGAFVAAPGSLIETGGGGDGGRNWDNGNGGPAGGGGSIVGRASARPNDPNFNLPMTSAIVAGTLKTGSPGSPGAHGPNGGQDGVVAPPAWIDIYVWALIEIRATATVITEILVINAGSGAIQLSSINSLVATVTRNIEIRTSGTLDLRGNTGATVLMTATTGFVWLRLAQSAGVLLDPGVSVWDLFDPAPFVTYGPLVTSYCTAGTSSEGCTPTMSSSGTPSASGSLPFTLSADGLPGQRSGVIFYSHTGASATAWSTGSTSFLCVKSPTQRTSTQTSSGTVGVCNGTLSLDWVAFVASHTNALGQPFSAGQSVWAQTWYRDPPAPKSTSLSDALAITLTP